jgi:hypothetical protein
VLKTLTQAPVAHGSALALSNSMGGLHMAATLDLSKYLLSQCTIVCSVAPQVMNNGSKPYNIIDQSCTHLVNQNGDAWLNQVILETYRTFRGAFNFVEHNQILSENKGRILDAVARKVLLMKPDPNQIKEEKNEIGFSGGAPSVSEFLKSLQPIIPVPKPQTPQKVHTNQVQYALDEFGEPKYVYYVDILVATALQFPRLIEQILDGEFNAMSMGCVVTGSTCSYCGHEIREPYPSFCQCLLGDRGTLKFHPEANKLVAVAELCGIPGDAQTNQFIEASWVADPAFIGARKAYIIDLPEGYSRKAYSIPTTPELKNVAKAAQVKAASAHDSMMIDNQVMRNTAIAFSHNPTLRNQINRYLTLYGFSIEPLSGRSTYPIQKNDQAEFTKTQALFKSLGLR